MRPVRWRVYWSPLGPVSADVVAVDDDGHAVQGWRASWVGTGPVRLRVIGKGGAGLSKRTQAFLARFRWPQWGAPADRSAEAAVRRRLAEARERGDLGSRA